MQNLEFNTGMIELAIQGDTNRVLRFNPGDESTVKGFMELLEKSTAMLKEADAKEKKICGSSNGLSQLEKVKQKNKLNMEIDAFLRNELDQLFGAGTAEITFGKMCITATATDGVPVFMGFLQALLKIIEEENRKRNKRVEDIIEKYKPRR